MNWRAVAGGLIVFNAMLAVTGCGSNSSTETFTGTIESAEVDVGTEIGGRIDTIYIAEGEGVKAGQALVLIDTTTLTLQLEQSQAAVETSKAKLSEAESGATHDELAQAQAEVSAAKANLEGAEKARTTAGSQLDRIKALQEIGVASKQELDSAQAQYDQKLTGEKAAKAQLEAASAGFNLVRAGAKEENLKVLRANVLQAEKAAEIVEANLGKAQVLAPAKGVAVSVNVAEGEIVNLGASLVTITDLTNLWVEVYVPEKYLDRVNVGDQALICITSVPDQNFKGEVTFIASEAEFTPEKANTEEERADTVFKVRVKIKEALDKFKPGMSAEVSFPDLAEKQK